MPIPSPPSRRNAPKRRLIKMADIPKWIENTYDIDSPPSRQTVYNWTKQGRFGVKLKTVRQLGQLYVTEKWLHDFAANLSKDDFK